MHQEMETAVIETQVLSGGNQEFQIDADEDRTIEGYALEITDIGPGDQFQAEAEAFVGVDPNVLPDSTNDLGGKFYAHAEATGFSDDTNGGVSTSEPISWDWNEDATVTLRVEEQSDSGDGCAARLTVYYSEHQDGL